LRTLFLNIVKYFYKKNLRGFDMAKQQSKSRGINIKATSVNIGGDVVGGDKKTTIKNSESSADRQSSSQAEKTTREGKSSRPIKILFLAANPHGTDRLRLDEEIREIKEVLLKAEFRDNFEIAQEWAVRTKDLQGHLLRHQPDIVHFSGHGSHGSEIILEDISGNVQPVSRGALANLFKVLKDNIRCVVLNACYSKEQAQAIAQNIDCVIGMSDAIADRAAINFALAFYQALGFGRNVKTAFDLGCNQIGLDPESADNEDVPHLIAENCDPEEVVLVQ
jgi:CHAT domain-containing protein